MQHSSVNGIIIGSMEIGLVDFTAQAAGLPTDDPETSVTVNNSRHEADKRLLIAATQRRVEAVNAALADGADPNCRNSGPDPAIAKSYFEDCTALQIACCTPLNTRVCAALLKAGADPNASDRHTKGRKPKHPYGRDTILCYQYLGVDLTRMLLEHGANPDLRCANGNAPLHYATVDQTKLLLDAGADPLLANAEGCTPLDCADGIMKTRLLKAAAEKRKTPGNCGAASVPENRRTVTNAVRRKATRRLLSVLLNLAMQPAWKRDFKTATNAVFDSLSDGADPNCRVGSEHGYYASWTMLQLLCTHSHPSYVAAWQCIEALLKAGADPDAGATDGSYRHNDNRDTPLCLADMHDEVTEMLLRYKADPNRRCMNGNSPLHYANIAQTKLLLAAGADPLLANAEGRTPLDCAGLAKTKLLKGAIEARRQQECRREGPTDRAAPRKSESDSGRRKPGPRRQLTIKKIESAIPGIPTPTPIIPTPAPASPPPVQRTAANAARSAPQPKITPPPASPPPHLPKAATPQGRRHPWSAADIATLVDLWERVGSNALIGIIMRRTTSSIQTKASRIGLPERGLTDPNHHRRWSAADDSMLDVAMNANRRQDGLLPIMAVAGSVGRSVDVVLARLTARHGEGADILQRLHVDIEDIAVAARSEPAKQPEPKKMVSASSSSADGKQRNCLRCGKPFWSWGSGNRICGTCSRSHDSEIAYY